MEAVAVDGTDLLSFAASLLVVVGTIVVLGWLYSRSKAFNGGRNDVINILASRAIGSKERLVVVEVAGKQLLVGMTASQVQTLHVFDAPVLTVPAVDDGAGFAARLRNTLKEMRR